MAKRANPPQLEGLRDFRAFCGYVWGQVFGLPSISPYQNDICDYLQKLPEFPDGINRGQIQAHRGAGKSYLTAALAVWHGYWHPDDKILVVSSTARRAEEFCSLSKQIIRSCDIFAHMAPRLGSEGSITGRDQTDNAAAFDFGHVTKPSKDPSIVAYGVSATMTGTHPDVIIADDIETMENGLTAGGRDKLMAKVHEFESLIQPKGQIIILGTPQSSESIYIQLKDSHPIRRWPAEYPDPENTTSTAHVSPWIMDSVEKNPGLIGEPTHPERFDQAALEVKKKQTGMTVYTLQMLIDTSLADEARYPLKLKDLVVMDLDPNVCNARIVWGTTKTEEKKWPHPGLEGDRMYGPAFIDPQMVEYDRKVMVIDPAGSGGDETAYCIAASMGGMLFLLDVGGYQDGNHPTTLTKLAKKARQFGVNDVYVEANFGDGAFAQLLMPIMAEVNGPTSITDFKVTARKEDRILDSMEPILFNHRLVIDTRVAKNHTFLYQYSHIQRRRGSLKHDDQIDVVAAAVAELSECLIHTLDEAAEEATKRAFEQRVDNWESYFRTSNGVGFRQFEDQYGRPMRSGKRSLLDNVHSRRRGGRRFR